MTKVQDVHVHFVDSQKIIRQEIAPRMAAAARKTGKKSLGIVAKLAQEGDMFSYGVYVTVQGKNRGEILNRVEKALRETVIRELAR